MGDMSATIWSKIIGHYPLCLPTFVWNWQSGESDKIVHIISNQLIEEKNGC